MFGSRATRPSTLREQLTGIVRHRCYRRMFDLALGRDGIELGFHAFGQADANEPMLSAEGSFEHGRHRREPMTLAGKLSQHRVVLELTEQQRPYIVAIEPLIKRSSNRRIVRG